MNLQKMVWAIGVKTNLKAEFLNEKEFKLNGILINVTRDRVVTDEICAKYTGVGSFLWALYNYALLPVEKDMIYEIKSYYLDSIVEDCKGNVYPASLKFEKR